MTSAKPQKYRQSEQQRQDRVQRELTRLLKDHRSDIRYVVVFPVSRVSNGFYDFANGRWAWNDIPESATFKRKQLAVAARRLLIEERRARGRRGHIFNGHSANIQVVAVQKSKNGVTFIQPVEARIGRYKPRLPTR